MNSAVERCAFNVDRAAGWLAELADLIEDLCLDTEAAPGIAWSGSNARAPMHRAATVLVNQLAGRRADTGPLDLLRRLERLANEAAERWPALEEGQRVGGVTVGSRGNAVELCGLCQEPVLGTAHDPARRIDGQAFHKSPCWYAVAMNRGIHPRARSRQNPA